MTDQNLGYSCSEAYKFISGGTAHTFTFNFQADKVVFTNLTQWTSTAGGLPINVWYRDQTTTAHAYQHKVIDSSAGASFNFVDVATNGFTVADTTGGVTDGHATITGITQADPCVITAATHGFQDGQLIRITDLGSDMPTARGMDELNNKRFKISYINVNSFSLIDPDTDEAIDSTSYTAYVSGGRATLVTRVIRPNNPYSGSYTANPFTYDPIEYKLTAGTSVMGSDGDVFLIEVYKWGDLIDLGDIG